MLRSFIKFAKSLINYLRGLSDEDWIVSARRNYSNTMLQKKSANKKPLSILDRNEILSFWKRFDKNSHKLYTIEQYAVYNKYLKEGSRLIDYIPDDFYYCYADTYFTNYHKSIIIDDKNLYDLYFKDVNRPRSVIRKISGVLMDSEYKIIESKQAVDLCMLHDSVVFKKSIDSDGGHGVKFIDISSSAQHCLRALIENEDNFIVQTIVKQHHVLADFNPQSVNTIRIMTLHFKGEIVVLSSVLRIGRNGSRIDNASSGGLVCVINPDGSLRSEAFDSFANIYHKHPQGKDFKGVIIPSFNECVELAKQLAPRFISYTRLISWDFSVDNYGAPILIEANLTGGQVDFHQLCNGPIWGDLTNEIMIEILANSDVVKTALN